MKKFKGRGFYLIVIFVLYSVVIFAEKEEVPPPWMEDVKVKGKSTYLVPKGAKRKVIGAQVVVEAPNEYVARRIYEMEMYLEKRLKEIEKNQEDLKKEFKELKEAVEDLKDLTKEEVIE